MLASLDAYFTMPAAPLESTALICWVSPAPKVVRSALMFREAGAFSTYTATGAITPLEAMM